MGRDRELAELETERRAAAGQFRVVLVLADAGTGKSRLANDFLARNRSRALTLAARAHPLGETSSFGVWADALESHLRGREAGYISELCEGYLDDIAVLVRSAALTRGGAPERDPPKVRLLGGLAGVLSKLAAGHPLILFLDDMHLADASSWEALGYLARTLSSVPVLVVCAARAAELAAQDVGNDVVLGLEQEARLRRMVLGPLAPVAIERLASMVVGEEPPPPLSRWLVDRSRGNPLFALSLLQGLLDEGVDLSSPDLRTLPQYVSDRIAQQLKRLDEPELLTLELLAVAGERVDLSDLLRLSGRPIEALSAILEALERARWVLEEERGKYIAYEIAHPLIRDAIYERIGGARRRALHRVIARAHFDQGRLGAAAAHFARSALPGDDEAVDALRDAVRQAEGREAYPEALAILDALVDLIPPGDVRWREVVEALSWRAEWVVDHRADTHAAMGIRGLRRMDTILEGIGAPAAQATVKFRLASFLAWGTGELEEAERVCEAALELFVEAGDRASALLAANERAWIRGLRGDSAGMEEGAQRVVEAAETTGEMFALLQGIATMGAAAGWLGHHARSRALWERSMDLAAREGKQYRLVLSLVSVALLRAHAGDVEEAMRLVAEAKSVAAWRESPLPEWESIIRWAVGDFPGALASAQEAAAVPGTPSKRRAFGLSHAVLSAIETDRPDEAQRFLHKALAAYGGRDWAYYFQFALYAQAMSDWHGGLIPQALTAMRHVSQRLLAMPAPHPAVYVLVDQAELAADVGSAETGREAAAGLASVERDQGADCFRPLVEVGLAWAGIAAGEPEAAATHARKALDLLSQQRLPFWTSRAHQALAHALRARDPADALSALEAAERGFLECGAVWRQRRTNEAMRRLGGAGRRLAARAGGPERLTRREREVARLAAQGHTAGEIAERLSISERTVEGHLGNAYAKLGVSSKLELVRNAQELNL